MLELVIRGGKVVTATDIFTADIGISKGTISVIGRGLKAEKIIDATNKFVLPGGIEGHCHIAQESATGGMTADDYRSGSISAATGGNSCFIPFAAQHKGMGVLETLDLYDTRANGQSVIDYSYHLIIADPTEKVLKKELPKAFARGVTSFKVFMTYDLMKIDDGQFLDILSIARSYGALTMVHAENDSIIKWTSEKLLKKGYNAPRYHAISHPAMAEEEAINRAITLSKFVDAPLMIVHVSTIKGAELVQQARLEGAKIFAETCPQYLFLTRKDLDLPGMEGAKYMCSPPVRDKATQTALWRHIQTGTFSLFSSDHAPYRFDKSGKLSSGPQPSFKKIANGMPGLAARLPLLFSEGVMKGRITLQKFVELSATNAAKMYGLYPQKGSIVIGGDADIAIWDPKMKRQMRVEDQNDNMDYSPYEGHIVTGWPTTVLSRGKLVISDGILVSEPGEGRYLRRKKIDLTGYPGYRADELEPALNFGADLQSDSSKEDI